MKRPTHPPVPPTPTPDATPDAISDATLDIRPNPAPDTASVRRTLWGEQAEAIQAALHALDPDLEALITGVVYEGVLARPGLDLKTRELLAVTALIGVGGERELKTHLRGALRCGATEQELREVIVQAAMFVGFPRALTAMRVLQSVRHPQARPDTEAPHTDKHG